MKRWCVALAAACTLLRVDTTRACAIAPPENQIVRMEAEDALIVWDAKSKTEHFIRRAQFDTQSKDFGFLVPTPSKPTLAEADDAVFDRIAEHTKPEIVTKRRYQLAPGGFLLRSKGETATASADGVNVLDVARVAGLDAVVLEADSATALGEWLTGHGYAFRKELVGWVEPYVKKRWKVTAFKIARSESSAAVGTKALRMSFTIAEPFFPYREPVSAAPPGPSRLLRVAFVSTERVEGKLEVGGAFPGRAVWAGALPSAPALLAGALPASDIPASAYLTLIEDGSDPRPGFSDVYFRRDAEQAELRRPPIVIDDVVYIPIPLELVLLTSCFGLAIGLVIFLRRKRSSG